MDLHWKEIIPGDQYTVSIDGEPNEGDLKVLTFLYQPLIGAICVSLYMTLRNQVEVGKLKSEPVSHYYIMNLLDLNLPEILKARQRLEAIGLLDSYVKTDGDIRSFVYLLKPPLAPAQFFSDGLLNIYLYQKIGRDYYQRLKHTFRDEPLDTNGFDKVTKGFQDIFVSSHYPYHEEFVKDDIEAKYPSKAESSPIAVSPEFFDFELFMAGINEGVLPKKAITPEVKEVILKLAFLYEIDAIQMKNILYSAIDENNAVDLEILRKSARDWYTIEHYSSLPKLVDRTQSPIYQSEIQAPKTKEDRLIRYLETVSPRQVMADLSEGSEPAAADLKLIEDIMFKQKLTPGVVNVLIQYCMLRSDMKLPKSFAEKIASHWARKKVKTVPEAMELAKSEQRQYEEWQQGKKEKEKKQTTYRKKTRTEPVPDWLEQRDEPQQKEETSKDFEERKKQLEERLKKYKK